MNIPHFFSCALALLMLTGAAEAALPRAIVEQLQAQKLPITAVSVYVSTLDGQVLLEHEADVPRRAASVMKLLTSQVALERLGPNWTWTTEVYAGGPIENGVLRGPLILRGNGDPALTLERFWLLFYQLRSQGLREIQGGLRIDQSAFTPRNPPPRQRLDDPWEVVPAPTFVNLQAVRLFFERRGEEVTVRAEPDLGWRLKHQFSVVDGPCEADIEDRWKPNIDWSQEPPVASLSGEFPRGCDTRILNLGIQDDGYYLGTLARQLWRQLGGEWLGPTEHGEVTAQDTLLLRQDSPALSRTLLEQNKASSNPMARLTFLTLGRAFALPGKSTVESAQATIRHWLKEQRLDFPELVIENGSGLAYAEQLSARHWGELLQVASRRPYFHELAASLPILGLDGTLRRYMRDTDAIGWGHLKTGSLSDTRAIAGYLTTRSGQQRIVVLVINAQGAARVKPVFEALLREIYEER